MYLVEMVADAVAGVKDGSIRIVLATAVLVPQVGSRITTTDQVLQLLELRAKNPSASGLEHHVVVPFQMPHSQAPSAGVFKSKTETRYIKRIK